VYSPRTLLTVEEDRARTEQRKPTVKTTVDFPEPRWRAVNIRALDERTDLRSVVVAALEAYLHVEVPHRKDADHAR
jgi:hypothetical protein